ncbi:hypothetical protein EDD18DRAFT_1467302 [Armillaria luteobubalina]|uniref:J domain-containing protein n=1 Tax=Armillaria luteobubalina TaxID=153913 RepID=A0AA39UCN2_9AGAR|nr:hypothetical protein EDD18DRAFT_1467302 [Armillaria luteobubalina]
MVFGLTLVRKLSSTTLLAIPSATAESEPTEPPTKAKAKKRKRDDVAEEPSQAKKPPADASNEKAPPPPPFNKTPPNQVDEEEVQPTTIRGRLERHADTNGIRHEQLEDIYHVLAGMQKNLCERQPEFSRHVSVRFAVEQFLIVPMKKDRTLVDGTGFLPHAAAREWREWHEKNITYPEFLHPTNKLPGEEIEETGAEKEEAESESKAFDQSLVCMPKLHLKRTPEEQAAHRERKRQKKQQKRREATADDDNDDGPSYNDIDAIQAELEEQRFRERMSMAFADDERLDSLEAQFNEFVHVPKRWGGDSARPVYDDDGDFMKLDPRYMDDEEYAEWIRAGMYRNTKKHGVARQRKLPWRAQEKAAKEESRRLERQAEEQRQQRRRNRDIRRRELARQEYESRWKELLSLPPANLHFDDIPWPIAAPRLSVTVEDLTLEAVSLFLFSEETTKKDKLRETYLRFHPDKFESRLMKLVKSGEQEKVRLGMGQVVRILNDLMKQGDG